MRGQPRRASGGSERPTLEDYQALLMAYHELQAQVEEHVQALRELAGQIDIKDTAIQRQTEDIRKLDTELLWTKAALEQGQKQMAAEQEKAEKQRSWEERYAQLQAEMDSVRKRWEERANEQTNKERNQILVDMLPLADHLELALHHAAENRADAQESVDNQQFLDNIQATLQAFLTTLKRYNVEPIEAHGQRFDPRLHEAVGRVVDDNIPVDHIAQIVQTGYRDGNRLLRPARVMISGQ